MTAFYELHVNRARFPNHEQIFVCNTQRSEIRGVYYKYHEIVLHGCPIRCIFLELGPQIEGVVLHGSRYSRVRISNLELQPYIHTWLKHTSMYGIC